MGFYGTFRNKKLIGNFLVGQSFGHMHQYFVFPFANAQLFNFMGINGMGLVFFLMEGLFVDIYANTKKYDGNDRNYNFNIQISCEIGIPAQLKEYQQGNNQGGKNKNSLLHLLKLAKSLLDLVHYGLGQFYLALHRPSCYMGC